MHPILFKIGAVTLYSWGLLVATGILLAIFLIYKNSAREGFIPDKILDGAFWTILAGFIGARAVYVIFHWELFQARPETALYVWQGGLAFQGALALGLTAALIYCWKNKINFLKIMDLAAPYAALAYGIGRLGCFLNGCCYGAICALPWAVNFPGLFGQRHPSQIYSALFGLGLFGFMLGYKKFRKFEGQLFISCIIFYSTYRFFLEMVREDPPYFFLGFNAIQIASVATQLAAVVFYIFLKFKNTRPR